MFWDKRCNLLIVTFDQMRGDWADPKRKLVNMPILEHLSAEGWTATKCYTSSPQCVPARFSWLTGLEPSQLGVTKNESVDLPGDVPSIIKWARQKGWYTELVGKTHWTSHQKGKNLENNKHLLNKLGFEEAIEIAGPRALQHVRCELTEIWKKRDVYEKHLEDMRRRYKGGRQPEAWKVRPSVLPNDLYPDIWIADQAVKNIRRLPTKKRWILWVSFVGPHEPFDTPKPWHGIHKNSILPEAVETPIWMTELTEECELKQQWNGWQGKLRDHEIKELRKDYADHLKLLDDQLSKLINACDARPDSQRIGVLVTSDHGEMLGDMNMLYKSTLLEQSLRVPFIYKGPNNSGKAKRFKKELSLTKLFHQTIYNIEKGGKAERLTKWAKSLNGIVVSEFGSERVFIRKKRKVCLNSNGSLLWGTKIDGGNCHEVYCSKKEIRSNGKWEKLLREAKEYTEKTKKQGWIWRDLKSS